MADLNTAIKIILSGGDSVSAGLRNVGGALSDLSRSAEGIAAPFADVAKYVEAADAALLGLATVAIAVSIKEATKFQSSLLDLQKQLDDTEGSAQSQAAVLEEIAQKYGQNANELVSSTADFKAAGYDMDTSIKLVTSSLDLMIAGGVKTSDAVDIINRSLAGFQIPANEVAGAAQHIGDVLNKAADLTKSSFSQLATGFADLSPIAKLTGLSFEETAALLTKVIDVFGSGSEAANALKSGFLALLTPSGDAKKELDKLGITLTDSSGKLKSVKDVLGALAPAFNGLTDSEKLHTAAVLFGTEQAGKFVQVLGNYGDAMSLAQTLTEQAGGSIEKEVTTRLQSAEVQFNRTAEALRQFEVHLGSQFLDAAAGASGGVAELINAFKTLVDNGALKPFTDLIEQGATRIGNTLRAMAANLPQAFAAVDFSGLLSSLGGLGDELGSLFRALFGDIDLTTVEGLADALQTVVNIGESLTLTTTGIIQAFKPFADAIGETVRHFNDLDQASKIEFGTFIGDMQAIVSAGGLVAGAIIAIGQSGLEMKSALDFVFGGLTALLNSFQVAFDTLALGVVKMAQAIAEGVRAIADAVGADEVAAHVGNAVNNLQMLADGINVNLTKNADELKAGLAQMAGQSTEASNKTTELHERLEHLKTGIADNREEILRNNSTMQDWSTGLQQAKGKVDDLTGRYMDWSDGLQKTDGRLKEIGVSQEALSKSTALDGNIRKTELYDEKLGKVITVYNGISTAHTGATGAFAAVGNSAQTSAAKIDEAAKATENYKIKMEEIASNERIKLIEAKVNLNIAGLEAQTKQVEATFKSIDNTVTSTGNLIGSLFGNLNSAKDTWTQWEITEQIALENDRRERALKLQEKLTEAQIDAINARVRALNRGDAVITVDGSGLAPHLEALMWEFFGAVQIKANATFNEFLLGLPTATA